MSAHTTKRSAALLLVILAVLGVYSFLNSPYFAVTDIVVEGNRYYSIEYLMEYTGLVKGENLFASDVRLAETRLTRLPFVRQARVRRLFPNCILISITEVDPLAMVLFGEDFWGVSAGGELLGPLPAGYPPLPIITGVDLNTSSRGRVGALALAAHLLQQLTPEVLDRVSEVSLRDRKDMVVITSDLIRVHLGDEGNLDKKLQVLNPLLLDIWKRHIPVKSVILNQYDNPVLKY